MNDAAVIHVFRAVADPTRRGILDRLADGASPVRALVEGFAMSQPALSKHLRILREAGLVAVEKVGRERHYRLRADGLRVVADWVRHYERFWTDRLDRLGDYLDGGA